MGLFGDDEIKKMMAEAEAMLTVKNRELFRKKFLEGYAYGKVHSLAGGLNEKIYAFHGLRDFAITKIYSLENWSYVVGVLAGWMKFAPVVLISLDNDAHLRIIKNLYSKCDTIGEEKARKIIRSLISAWQRRIKGELAKSTSLSRDNIRFLAGLKGL